MRIKIELFAFEHRKFPQRKLFQVYAVFPCVFFLALSMNVFGQSTTVRRSLNTDTTQIVTGIVKDSAGSPLSGVSIFVQKDLKHGTFSDPNGKFILSASKGDVVVFSMTGYVNEQRVVSDSTFFNVLLFPAENDLKDAVVIAFGKEKKEDVVGSVVSVDPKQLKVPASNLTAAFAGRVPGMIAFQRSGEPGADNANFFIRGVSTFGTNTNPLILIDGIESSTNDLARLQVDDINSFSVLKDATATALYGSRAANGVLLITTKGGKVGMAKINFRAENSISEPTKNIKLADPVTYMKLANESVLTRDPLGVTKYSDDKIENTAAGTNPVIFPANDWMKLLFKDRTSTQRYNMSLSGGGGVARYYVSGSLNHDNGLMKVARQNNFNNNISLTSYSLRSNVDVDLTKFTKLTVRLSGSFDDYTGPPLGNSSTSAGTAIYNEIVHSNPVLFPAYYPIDSAHSYVKHVMFGNYENGQYLNPYADMVRGYKQYSRSQLNAQLEFNQDFDFIVKGLAFNAMFNVGRYSYFDITRQYNPFWYGLEGYDIVNNKYYLNLINPDQGTEYLDYNSSNGTKELSTSFYFQARLNYTHDFGEKNHLSSMLVYMLENRVNANAGDLQQSLPYRNLGLSGRTTYDYDKRYFVEFNFGYNGSERFDPHHRFGFFPSAGVAWTISNESFFAGLKGAVTNLKLRATYGLIGNDAIGSADDRFFYLSNVNMNNGGRGAIFGKDLNYQLNGISISRYADPNISWETSTQQNYAVDLNLFNQIDITAEYYKQHRKNILMDRAAIPLEAGFAAPIRANVGEAEGSGVDLSINYKKSFRKSLWMAFMGNFTYAKTHFSKFEEPDYKEDYRSHVGVLLNQQYGFIAERLFVDDQEALNSPFQNYGIYAGGDIKYLDVNDDGQITEADKVPIGFPTTPEIIYGFGFSLGYKRWDVSAFFQGLTNESFFIDPNATWPFASNSINGQTFYNALLKTYADSHWSEENRNIYALFPRLSEGVNVNDIQTSTWWLRNGSFLRLKQVELGYNMPDRLIKKLHSSGLRIYVNATNLLNFSSFNLWDVEMGGNGLGYPIQRVFNVGLNLNIN